MIKIIMIIIIMIVKIAVMITMIITIIITIMTVIMIMMHNHVRSFWCQLIELKTFCHFFQTPIQSITNLFRILNWNKPFGIIIKWYRYPYHDTVDKSIMHIAKWLMAQVEISKYWNFLSWIFFVNFRNDKSCWIYWYW